MPRPSLPPLAAAIATAATCLTWAVARSTGQVLLIHRGSVTVPVPLGAVALATLAGALAAAGLARIACRSRNANRVYLGLCALGLALGAVPPLLSADTTGSAAWLMVLHAVAAAILIPAARPLQVLVARAQ